MNHDGDVLCRDCATLTTGIARTRCPSCGSPRLVRHPELPNLSIAHLDCDAFYAAVEKRDDPSLRNRPVIVGGGRRGVVSAACYVARRYGVHSTMPMFKALDACPDAVVIRPDMDKYAAVGRRIRTMMRELTPVIEPLSIDEAFLDLGPVRYHHEELPATLLARLASHIEREIGISVSIGLSYNKFLAKLASERDKPRGFAVIGRSEIMDLYPPGSMTSTHSASPLSVAAAIAGIKAILEDNLTEHARLLGEVLRDELLRIRAKYPDVLGCVQARGLVGGVQVVKPGTRTPWPETALRISEQCFRKGLLMFAPVGVGGECLKIAPPLAINEEALREGLGVLEEACDEVLG